MKDKSEQQTHYMTRKSRSGAPLNQASTIKRHIFRFACAGVVGFLVDAGTLYLMLDLRLGAYVGQAIAFLLAVLCTWLLNRTFTFEPKKRDNGRSRQTLVREFGKYLLAMAAGGCVNYLTYCFALSLLPHAPASPLIGVAAGSIAGLFVNFTAARFWVYR
jgi:putative flippase GtrA